MEGGTIADRYQGQGMVGTIRWFLPDTLTLTLTLTNADSAPIGCVVSSR